MGRNMAKRMANMVLVYWKPNLSGSGPKYDPPVEFAGKYIGNCRIDGGGPSDVAYSGGGVRDNLVLFYMLEPEVEGCVCWSKTLAEIKADGSDALDPSEVSGAHKIKSVSTYVMPSAKTAGLANCAYIAQVT